MIKCVVFDIGNTLHRETSKDNAKAHLENVRLLRKLGYNVTYPLYKGALDRAWEKRNRVRRKTNDLPRQVLVELGLPPSLSLAKKLTDSFFTMRLCIHLKKKIPRDVSSIFSFLKKKGIVVGIITNADSSWSKKWLKKQGLNIPARLFIISHEVETRKPFRKIFDLFYTRLKKVDSTIKREDILMVGDSFKDLFAKMAGFRACWYNPKKKSRKHLPILPDYEITHFSELKKILQSPA